MTHNKKADVRTLSQNLITVALPVPLRRLFTYQVAQPGAYIGRRVKVPFGKQELIGIIVDQPNTTDLPENKLKPANLIIDEHPVIPQNTLWDLIFKVSQYYHHSLGDCFATALPNALMKGESCTLSPEIFWSITPTGVEAKTSLSKRAVKQQKALTYLENENHPVNQDELKHVEISTATLKTLLEKGWVEKHLITPKAPKITTGEKKSLNKEQLEAYKEVTSTNDQFVATLLEGITGSGKTEVYLQVIEEQLNTNRQVLILIPEIGLTPQTLKRFEQRFPGHVGVIHSGLTDKQRLNTWLKAREGALRIIIGTRSAIFTPLKWPGMIIIDEEHDLSFKQQDGLRYSSRDIALLRGQMENIPVLLGSATPSLESLNNALSGKYRHIKLTQRATGQSLPTIKLLDCKNQPMIEGFSQPLLKSIESHIQAGNQVLVFINRRGFAPVLLCHQCGWIADCTRCDSYMTLHQSKHNEYLQCHHCGRYQNKIHNCPKCNSTELVSVGQGTERIEKFLSDRFPNISLQRIDRDTTRRKDSMKNYIEAAKKGETQLLVGTQMIAKGHHFPKVTLVAILDIDGALFSSDFRAPERAAQLITQVAGRAGRAERKGEVVVQTHHPEHSLLQALLQNDYHQLATKLLADRNEAQLPPHTYVALFRSESTNKDSAYEFLAFVKQNFSQFMNQLEVLGPVASTISRKAGRFRFQLLLNSPSRKALHSAINERMDEIEQSSLASKVRWSLDIDAQDLL
ncbi:primosomal protein N' [Pleionea sediminis]|uniref:primosomal protein N' n=1 Tax=Pleionea sediminis TaxID=2569479 RepID=UPI00197C63D2|nr:primosomal protein N' [Pleionea sediminis]